TELEQRRRDGEARLRRGHAGEALAGADRIGQLGPGELLQARLVVEQIHLRRRAGLEEIDDALGGRRKVRQRFVGVEQAREGRDAESGAGLSEEIASCEQARGIYHYWRHSLVTAASRLRIMLATVA